MDSTSLVINHPITILGNGTGVTILDGELKNAFFENQSSLLSVYHLKMINGFSNTQKHPIHNIGTLHMKDIILENNQVNSESKAISNEGTIVIKPGQAVRIKK